MGACEVGVWVRVKRVCKCTGPGKKKKKSEKNKTKKQKADLPVQTPTKTRTSTGLACHACAWLQCGRVERHARVAWQWWQREGNGSSCGSVIRWQVWTAEFVKTCDGIGASNSRCKVRREAHGWPGVDGGAHKVGGKRKKKKDLNMHKKRDWLVVLCVRSQCVGRQFAGVV